MSPLLSFAPAASEEEVRTPTSSRWSSEDLDCSPSVVVKNTFIDGFEMPLDSPARPRRARSCPCDGTKRCASSSAVEGVSAQVEITTDVCASLEVGCSMGEEQTDSEEASTKAGDYVASTPLDTPRSSCTQVSDRTLDGTPTRKPISLADDLLVVVRLSDHVPTFQRQIDSLPLYERNLISPSASHCAAPWAEVSSPASGFGAVHVPPPPPSQPAPGSTSLPSVGSAGHASGHCKPCAFLHTKGCANGLNCSFCHLCAPDERKFRQREKKAMAQRRAIVKARAAMQLVK